MGTATMDPVTMDPSHGMDMNSTDGTMVHHMMMMMPMYFTLDFPDVFLLEQWKITKDWHILVMCIGSLVLACVYELFKDFRTMWNKGYFSDRILNFEGPSTGDCCDNDTEFSSMQDGFCCRHFVQSILHIIQSGIAFVLMLIAMTFNVQLLSAVCVGNGLGYLIAGCIRKSIETTHRRKLKRRAQQMLQMRRESEMNGNMKNNQDMRANSVVYDNYAMTSNFDY